MREGDQVKAFQAYYSLWVLDKKKPEPDPQTINLENQLQQIFLSTFVLNKSIHVVNLNSQPEKQTYCRLVQFI